MCYAVGVVPFPGDKLALVNKTAELPDGRTLQTTEDGTDNYANMFGVFHQLYCLVCTRQRLETLTTCVLNGGSCKF